MDENGATRTTEEVRREIEHTREGLADTAAALAEKADVKAQVHRRVEEVKSDVREKVHNVGDTAASAADSTKHSVQEHPIPWALVATALLGISLGYLWAKHSG